MTFRIAVPLAVCVAVAFLAVLGAHAQVMPDPREIAGVPLPVGDVAVGTVTVRVIKGSLANNVPGQPVELSVGGVSRRETTGESGRAEFSGLSVGARVKAMAVVGSERLESQEFAVPSAGGIRVLLVATDPDAEKRAAEDRRLAAGPAQRGMVVLGDQSRFVVELGDAALNVFNILQIVNTARVPVEPRDPVVFEAARGGGTITILNGSSPRATVEGSRVKVAGPFAPGSTLVQFAYAVPYSGGDLTIEQRLPIALNQVIVMAQKVGDMRLGSPQVAQQREVAAQGDMYIVGQGPGVAAGNALRLSFTGLPHSATWPRNLALALAAVILCGGAWSSVRSGRTESVAPNREALESQRDRLFAELASIERQRLAAASDGSRAAVNDRRRALISELESVYAALDS
jgi:hypothetical protein